MGSTYHKVLETRRQKKSQVIAGHSMQKGLNLPLLTLKREKETSYNSRNVGHIQKLEKARKHVLP